MKKHFILFTLLLAALSVQAQQVPPSLGIFMKSGSETSFTLDYIQKLTFFDGNVVVTMKEGAEKSGSFALSDIKYMHFFATGAVETEKVGDFFVWSPLTNELTVRCTPGTVIRIYSSNGRQVLTAIQSIAQSPISLATLPSGIYIVEAGDKTTKIQHR